MTEYKTLRVPKDAWEAAKAQKEEHDRTWGEQLVCSNHATTESESVEESVVDAGEIAHEIEQAIDSAAFNGSMSDEKADAILTRLDELEAQLPSKTADELEGRMR